MRSGLVSCVVIATMLAPVRAGAAPGELCGQYDTRDVENGYVVQANRWNSTGELCVTTPGGPAFTVSKSTLTNGNKADAARGPGGYPNIGTRPDDPRLPLRIADLGEASTSWSTNSPDTGMYNASYDLWFHPDKNACGGVITDNRSLEVMVWLKSPGLDLPAEWKSGDDVTIGGNLYDVYHFTGPTGQFALIYHLSTPASSVTDLKLAPIAVDAAERSPLDTTGVLCRVQAGFEIHENAPEGLATTAFSFDPKGTTTPSLLPKLAEPSWSEEFDGADGSAPDKKLWTAGTGDHGTLQYFTAGNAEIVKRGTGGYLALTARKNTDAAYECAHRPGGLGAGTCAYTSAQLSMTKDRAVTYGRIEARIKLPGGTGVLPAFYLLGTGGRWPDDGEIDVVQSLGDAGCLLCSTLHGPGDYASAGKVSSGLTNDQVSEDFHVYGVERSPEQVQFSIDGRPTLTVRKDQVPAKSWVFDKPMYPLLSMLVGGPAARDPLPTTKFPQTMLVDYVRAYAAQAQEAPEPGATPTTPQDQDKPAPGQQPQGQTVFTDGFGDGDGSGWQVTSGQFVRRGGVGWTNSPIFRANTVRHDFTDVSVSVRLRHLGNTGGGAATDGIHIWLRHVDQFKLYVVSVNRRDNRIVIKKKLPGGPDPANGGTYYELGSVGYQVPANQWQSFTATSKTVGGAVQISVTQGGKVLLTVSDKGEGGPPILEPGAVGLRSDNTTFEADDFQVRPA
ncbi:hypothetical protein GCM10010468_02310 [Actinocorallia longicatena]|uniref:GH16 domain-containing protein n=1 Tax=Actinocorallia longicatena TaxID=111803 RepID=A0ABP6PX40_9ACTN